MFEMTIFKVKNTFQKKFHLQVTLQVVENGNALKHSIYTQLTSCSTRSLEVTLVFTLTEKALK